MGRAMTQVIRYWIQIAEARAESQSSPYVICCGRSGTESGFYSRTSTSSCRYHFTIVHTHL